MNHERRFHACHHDASLFHQLSDWHGQELPLIMFLLLILGLFLVPCKFVAMIKGKLTRSGRIFARAPVAFSCLRKWRHPFSLSQALPDRFFQPVGLPAQHASRCRSTMNCIRERREGVYYGCGDGCKITGRVAMAISGWGLSLRATLRKKWCSRNPPSSASESFCFASRGFACDSSLLIKYPITREAHENNPRFG